MSLRTILTPSAAPASDLPARFGGESATTFNRAAAWGFGLLVIAGSILFLAGGRAHPAIGAGAGDGAEAFFRTFAETVHRTHDWHGMHMLILVGPLFWAVAAPGLLDAIRPGLLISAGRSALLLSAALWAMAFVQDGFGAPVYAEAIVRAAPPETALGLTTSFQANAIMMSRLGLVSWVAGGLGMAALGGSLLLPGVRTLWRGVVGVSGIVIGAWPLLAALEGEYAGGPFVSSFWMANALVVAIWYIALATCASGRRLQ